jgi:hypothetical protein
MTESGKKTEVKWYPRIEAPDLSESEFADLCARAVESALPGAVVKVSGPMSLKVEAKHGASKEPIHFTMNLDNAWAACSKAPGNRKELLKPYFNHLDEFLLAADRQNIDVSQHVVPLVRTQEFFTHTGMGSKVEAVSEPLGADLLLVYGVDSPQSISYMQPKQRALIKLSDSQLRE